MKKVYTLLLFIILGFTLLSCDKNDDKLPDLNYEEEIKYPMLEFELLEEEMELQANDDYFSPSNAVYLENHPLKGKTIYWLGSSVTYGSASNGSSMADYMEAMTGANCIKDAVSGTTIFDDGSVGNYGSKSYTRRLKTSSYFSVDEKVDAFICQISTNDARTELCSNKGVISEGIIDFDLTTTLGGIEFIINYVKETWGCPIYFYSGSFISVSGVRSSSNPNYINYNSLVNDVIKIVEKYNKIEGFKVGIIDLFNDKEFNNLIDDKTYMWMMSDPIHPKKAGYYKWWSPYFINFLGKEFHEK